MDPVRPSLRLAVALLCAASCLSPATGAAPAARVRLVPHYAPGQVLRYQMDFRTRIDSRSVGPIENPEAPSQLQLWVSATVRIDVLRIGPNSAKGGEAVRLRATCEKATATARSDSYDPQAATLEQQYRNLAGRSIEFTLSPDGRLGDVQGLREAVPDERAASGIRQWLGAFSGSAALPRRGIKIGEKWTAEQPVTTAPLKGIVLRTESTYLRNEACEPRALAKLEGSAAAGSGETCAVILAESQMSPRHAQRDPTPEDYRRRDLRTRGQWASTGESLSYVSLRTGWVVSVTQTGTENMDVTIASVDSGSQVRYTAKLQSESQITLLPASSSAAPAH
jgi:hypothetical protein